MCSFSSSLRPSATGYLGHTEEPPYSIHIEPLTGQLIKRKMVNTENESNELLNIFLKL